MKYLRYLVERAQEGDLPQEMLDLLREIQQKFPAPATPKLEIIRTKGTEVTCKRLAVPYILRGTCPKCGEVCEQNYTDGGWYLSYPIAGEVTDIHFYCYSCDSGFEIPMKFDVTLEEV